MPEEDSIDKEFFKGVSASIVFTDSSKAFETATSVLRMQGRLVMAGLPEKPAPLLTADLCFKGIHVVGKCELPFASKGFPRANFITVTFHRRVRQYV